MARKPTRLMQKFYKNILSKKTANIIYDEFINLILANKNNTNNYVTLNNDYLEKTCLATFDFLNNPEHNGEKSKTFAIYDLPVTKLEINSIDEMIRKDFGNSYRFTHSYIRCYTNGSILNPHIDSPGLDLTLTVNIHSNDTDNWPICFSKKELMGEDYEKYISLVTSQREIESYSFLRDYMNDYSEYVTKKGDGICSTRYFPHWRMPYEVENPGQHFVQVFYHWIKE